MSDTYRKIVIDNASCYSKVGGISFPGALLKSSLIPFDLLDRFIPGNAKILDLGCGEGMLSNSIGRLFPSAKVHGIDTDRDKIEKAMLCRQDNVHFQQDDAGTCDLGDVDAIIFNDMLHHNPNQKQKEIIRHAHSLLNEGGLVILKEVDRKDIADKLLTTFFDKRLYPDDQLNFKTVDEWKNLLEEHNFKILNVEVVRHPWVASRTVLIAKKCPEPLCYAEENGMKYSNDGRLRIFLTGASGFIGHHMAASLLENGINGQAVELFLLARNPVRLDSAICEKSKVIKGDLQSLKNLSHWELWKHIDYVFHFAAEVKINGVPEALLQNNSEGTRHLIKLFKGKQLKRFVHSSTMGAIDRLPDDPCTDPMNENTPPHPLSFYGKTKLEAERIVQDSGIPFSIIRMPWVFGSRMTPDTHVRNLFEKVMLRSSSTRIDFPGKVSLIAVEDLVKAFELVATNHEAHNEIFFVAGHPPVSLGNLFKRMESILIGKSVSRLPVPFYLQAVAKKIRRFLPLILQNLNSDVLCVDSEKITKIGFKPVYDLDYSLVRLSSWIHRQRRPEIKTCFVTGAASGIGLALSKKLAGSGKRVFLIDNDREKLIKVADMLDAPFLCCDLSKSSDLELLSECMKNEKDFYALINCAGIGKKDALVDMTSEIMEKIISVNISAVAKLSKEALSILSKKRKGVLVNISSSSALQPLPYFSVYAASKSFVSSFTESVCYEHKKEADIRILNIVPSGTDTAFQSSAGVKKNPKERLLTSEYVADRIALLIENRACSGTYSIGNRGKLMSLLARMLPVKLNRNLWGYLVDKTR